MPEYPDCFADARRERYESIYERGLKLAHDLDARLVLAARLDDEAEEYRLDVIGNAIGGLSDGRFAWSYERQVSDAGFDAESDGYSVEQAETRAAEQWIADVEDALSTRPHPLVMARAA